MKTYEIFPYLSVKNAAQAIEFYTQVFIAKEKFRLAEPGGRIGHAELDFDGMTLMLADEFPEYGIKGPDLTGSVPVSIHLHVDITDAVTLSIPPAKPQTRMA